MIFFFICKTLFGYMADGSNALSVSKYVAWLQNKQSFSSFFFSYFLLLSFSFFEQAPLAVWVVKEAAESFLLLLLLSPSRNLNENLSVAFSCCYEIKRHFEGVLMCVLRLAL